jgi:hypothetical protein
MEEMTSKHLSFILFISTVFGLACEQNDVTFSQMYKKAALYGRMSTFVTKIRLQKTSFKVVPIFLKSFYFWVSYIHFLKFS